MGTLTAKARIQILVAAVGFIATYVRNIVQYHQYSWDSIETFLGSWLAHYIAILFGSAIACGIAKSEFSARLGASDDLRRLSFEDAAILAALFVLAISAMMFLGTGLNDGDE